MRFVNRAESMLTLDIGDLIKAKVIVRDDHGNLLKNENGIILKKEKMIGKHALHIQTCYRWTLNNNIILSFNDLFQPTSKMLQDAEFDFDNFDPEPIGNNRFDKLIVDYFKKDKLEDFIVDDVKANKFGDLTIVFANGFILQVFCDQSENYEVWRFFERTNEEKFHLVILSTGIEYEN